MATEDALFWILILKENKLHKIRTRPLTGYQHYDIIWPTGVTDYRLTSIFSQQSYPVGD